MSLWHQSASSYGYAKGTKLFGINAVLTTLSIIFEGTKTHLFYESESLKKNSEKVLKFVSTEKGIKDLKQKYISLSRNLLQSLKICDQKLNYLNLKRFIRNYEIYTGGLNITAMVGRFVALKLKEEIEKMGFENSDHVLAQVTYPSSRTPLYISEFDILKIAHKIKQDKKSDPVKHLNQWLKKHQHIPVNYCEEPWTIKDAYDQLDNALKQDVAEALVNLENNHKLRLETKRKLLKKFKKETKILAKAVAEATSLNEFRKQVFCKVSLGYRNIFKKIASMLGSEDWRDCFYLTSDEMLSVLKGKKFNLDKIKLQRNVVGIEYTHAGKTSFMKGRHLKVFVDDLPVNVDNNHREVSEFSGVSASKGITRGTVKVILSRSDFSKFKRGDILVAPMTSVDYVPIMSMAGAFVTNEGGITSHASIVSREMNKPCIIGTKIATKVLKDGDEVEVDANKGIVTIIKKVK